VLALQWHVHPQFSPNPAIHRNAPPPLSLLFKKVRTDPFLLPQTLKHSLVAIPNAAGSMNCYFP
jgi:hypothetical protein